MGDVGTNVPRVDVAEILAGIERWVRIESPTSDAPSVNRMIDEAERDQRTLGAVIERFPGRDGFGDILKARTAWGGDGPGILVLAHLDTVHPIGTIDGPLTLRHEGDKVFGPSIYDMKGGGFLAQYALQHLVRQGRQSDLPITFLFIPEEEVGSPISRAVIEDEARKNKYVLVAEPARDGGRVVTGRKGSARFRLHIQGRQAHSGGAHAEGRSAIREMAHQILRIEALTDYDRGITTNVGEVEGGTRANVVPGEYRAHVDARFPDPQAADAVVAALLGLKPVGPDMAVTVSGGIMRPPFQKNDAIAALFEQASSLASEIGFDLEDTISGGGSDGNFTAALGIPTLDGLGPAGHGAHTLDEHILISSLEPRARLWIRLFETLR